ncbi:MarR family winged helix-turn-helix transcriptional regulator [Mycolicibacterium canariasense]|nr:MarR family transcriptional regulator [Mycolicibacterium canariasense]MCV7211279.1 MarR family transcriptional regulator [Mycolicibacterium canariasense]ORV04028.1 MarR family transcriptional regulator [Mycolicibacterium canariasense]
MEVTSRDDGAPIRELALALHELSWRLTRFGPIRAGLDPLPSSELAVLRAIVDEPGLSVSDVAAAVAMQSSNVSAAIRALVERGLVSKTPREDDRRVSMLHPTLKARNDKRAIDDALADGIVEVLAGLPAESVAALLSAAPAMRGLAGALARPSKPAVARIADSGSEP